MEDKKTIKKKLKSIKKGMKDVKNLTKNNPQEAKKTALKIVKDCEYLEKLEICKYNPKLLKEVGKAKDMLKLFVSNLEGMEKINKKWKKN